MGDTPIPGSTHRLVQRLRYQLIALPRRVRSMNVTSLNIFRWCKFLRHLGRLLMASIVAAIVCLAVYAVFEAALVPGLQSHSPGLVVLWALLAVLYLCTVCA